MDMGCICQVKSNWSSDSVTSFVLCRNINSLCRLKQGSVHTLMQVGSRGAGTCMMHDA